MTEKPDAEFLTVLAFFQTSKILGIADDARFVDLFVSEAYFGRRNLLLVGKKVLICPRRYFATLLRRVVLVGEAALGTGFNLKGGRERLGCLIFAGFLKFRRRAE